MTTKILLAGETFVVSQSVAIGYDTLLSNSRANGAGYFLEAFADSNYDIEQIPTECCEREFPKTIDQLQRYGAIILSDIGALTLLFTPETRMGVPSVNRLKLIQDWVHQGGSLMMAGGYNSFQGMSGTARYHDTYIEDCLPITCLPHSDGLEAPEGLVPQPVQQHPILTGLDFKWPRILGLNKVIVRQEKDTQLVMTVQSRGHHLPLLAVRYFGEGRTLSWMTDIGPHWTSQEFVSGAAYKPLMRNMVSWLCKDL
jgi:uncharacterized membrane protein